MKAVHYLVQTVRLLIVLLFLAYVTADLYFDYFPQISDWVLGHRQTIWMLVFLEAGFTFGKMYQAWYHRKTCMRRYYGHDPKRVNFVNIQKGDLK